MASIDKSDQSSPLGQFKYCGCFLTDNYYLKDLDLHLSLPLNCLEMSKVELEKHIVKSWRQRLHSRSTDNLQEQLHELSSSGVLSRCAEELLAERTRREAEDEASSRREAAISSQHVYKNPGLFCFDDAVSQQSILDSRFIALVNACQTSLKQNSEISLDSLKQFGLKQELEDVFSFPIFNESFCHEFRSELSHFVDTSPVKTGRANTMHRDGLLLDELRPIRAWLDRLRSDWLQPLVDCLLPDAANGAQLDSHRAFTVLYQPGRDTGLGYHYDNAEATLNVCLTESDSYHGNGLFFGHLVQPKIGAVCPLILRDQLDKLPVIGQRLGWGLLHPGLQMHGVRQLLSGCRLNLILWMRASRLRNRLCPRCWRRPSGTRPSRRYGDGMT